MKIRFVFISTLFLTNLLITFAAKAHDTRVYEKRTYYAEEGKLDDLLARFRDHTCAIFARHGIENVGYWIPKDNPDNTLVYIIAYPSRLDQEVMWKNFLNDPEWKAAAAASTANGKLVKKVDRVFMQTTDFSMPVKKIQSDPARLFELRTYTAEEGRLHHLDARFRDHTIRIFERNSMDNIVYFHPMADQEGAGNTLIYMIAHKNEAAKDASWAGFRQDPEWQAARAASEERAGGGLTIKGGVKSQLLVPTDFSPMR
ncbi:MAG: NIPSNAP family protein [Verrucomicrobiae bacterium]|nr:NIPSNAP family protein [Verrucomicrobiae bacterium]